MRANLSKNKYLIALPVFVGDKGFNHQTILVSAVSVPDAISLVHHLRGSCNIGEIEMQKPTYPHS